MKRKAKTTKNFRLAGKQTYINSDTGEAVEMDVLEVDEKDANFQKLWIANILQAIKELSSQRMRIIFWLVDQASNYKNVIPKTVTEIASELKMSRTTVTETFKILEKNDIIRKKTGVIFMNPDVIFQGSHSSRMNVLIRYRSIPINEKIFEDSNKSPASPDLLENPELLDALLDDEQLIDEWSAAE
jgi:DNA-binding Lrp family transcriptional regulator